VSSVTGAKDEKCDLGTLLTVIGKEIIVKL
jgi:hypothetical protein